MKTGPTRHSRHPGRLARLYPPGQSQGRGLPYPPGGRGAPRLGLTPGELADDQYEAAHLFVRDRLRIRLTVNGPNGLQKVFTDAGQPAHEAATYFMPEVEGEGSGNALDLAALRQNLSACWKPWPNCRDGCSQPRESQFAWLEN